MKFLQCKHLKINAALSRTEALKRLDQKVITPACHRSQLVEASLRPYRGSIEGSHFELVRVVGDMVGRARDFIFVPVIKGDIQSKFSGCSVDITMQPHSQITG